MRALIFIKNLDKSQAFRSKKVVVRLPEEPSEALALKVAEYALHGREVLLRRIGRAEQHHDSVYRGPIERGKIDAAT